MAARDIIRARLDAIAWWWQKYRMGLFLRETRYRHYCSDCGGIMHYGVHFYPTYDYTTGQPYGVQFIVACENYELVPSHDKFRKFMFKSPFLLDYLRSNMYILGAQTILDVYEEES